MEKEQKVDEAATEAKIFAAARAVFYRNGYNGARMQDIANEAGINKAMLHYYYRSKDKLFEAIFKEALATIFPTIFRILSSELPLEEKVRSFIREYTDFLLKNPDLPMFVIHELAVKPERLHKVFEEQGVKLPQLLLQQLQDTAASPNDPRQLMASLLGMCIFPFVAAPILRHILQMDEETYRTFLKERVEHLPDFYLGGLGIR